MGRLAPGFQQGNLDTLCGLYAVIHASRMAVRPFRILSRADCTSLFATFLEDLDARGMLVTAVSSGLGYAEVSRLLRAADRWLVERHGIRLSFRKPYHRHRSVPRPEFVEVCRRHLEGPAASVMFCITGRANHWTVLSAVGKHRLTLVDSNGRKFLRRSGLTIAAGCAETGTVVVPSCFYLIAAQMAAEHGG